MTVDRTTTTSMLAFIVILGSGCEADLEQLRTKEGYPCEVVFEGTKYFLGDPTCFRALPEKTMRGFWVSGHEYSAFFRERPPYPPDFKADVTWLQLSNAARAVVDPRTHDGELHLFEVEFRGRDANRLGIYGSGPSSRGAFAERFTIFKEVSTSEWHGAR
jgi:hypothetical protein